jgi:hypothetical protein
MTELEFQLSKKIHRQRVRLRKLEQLVTARADAFAYNRSKWLDKAIQYHKENQQLKAKVQRLKIFVNSVYPSIPK